MEFENRETPVTEEMLPEDPGASGDAAVQPEAEAPPVEKVVETPPPAGAKKNGFRWWMAAVPVAVVTVVVGAFLIGQAVSASKVAALEAQAAEARAEAEERKAAVAAGGQIGYATNAVASDPVTLQQQVDEMYAKADEPGIALEYKNVMVSEDGLNFDCYIGNSADNIYDMFIAIYADAQMTDELFLSDLLRPGSRFEKLTLERKLEPGNYTGYVVYTQVKDEAETGDVPIQVIQAQVATTIDIKVNG